MFDLEDIIDAPEGLEIKRVLAVKMIIDDFKTKEICSLLDVSDSFVSQWKTIDENEGAEG
jgi:predicted transcriptional regulator